jgi:predicted Fe-S protein YdhL (DUF1289 family)
MTYETREDGQLIWTNPRSGKRYCRSSRQPNCVGVNRWHDVVRWSGLTDYELRLAIESLERRVRTSEHVREDCQASDGLSDALAFAKDERARRWGE